MVEEGRFKNDPLDGVQIEDVPYLRELVQRYRDDPDFTTEWFFSYALLGYYDAMWGGLNGTAGHIIYRLSDAIKKSQRETMHIYPSSTGSIIILEHTGRGKDEGVRWDSLEDWRKQWERDNPVIPEYTKKLPGGFSLEKPNKLGTP